MMRLSLALCLVASCIGDLPEGDDDDPNVDDIDAPGFAAHACPQYSASGTPLRGSCMSVKRTHDDQCVRTTNDAVIALRYPDGTPTGSSVDPKTILYKPDAANPATDDSDGHACANAMGGVGGELVVDAQEIVVDAGGNWMVFRRGGSPNAVAKDARYGHVWLKDLADVASLHLETLASDSVAAGLDAMTCAASKNAETKGTFVMKPVSLAGLDYWSFDHTRTMGFNTYGDPGSLGSQPKASYADLLWNFVNANGGGVVRALIPADANHPFYRCNVNMLKATAVSATTHQPIGYVKAMYGKTPAANHTWLYGWVIYEHKCTSAECGAIGTFKHVTAI